MKERKLKTLFILLDLITAGIAWGLFFYYRKFAIEKVPFEITSQFYYGMVIVPFFWFCLYYILGTYNNLRKIYLMKMLSLSMRAFIIGSLCLFFFVLIDDEIYKPTDYYKLILFIFFIHGFLTLLPRFLITFYNVRLIQSRKAGFKTLLVGGSSKAVDIYNEIQDLPKGIGSIFVGFISLNDIDQEMASKMEYLGELKDLEKIIDEYQIEEVIVALDSSERELLKRIITRLQGRDVSIKMTADMYDVISGSAKITNIFGAFLIEVNDDLMPFWQFVVKRIIDLISSTIAITLLIPVYILLAILVKASSKGPVFFLQDRIGKDGKPFKIIKFRTMVVNAEKEGPQLSSKHDSRITNIGRFMRKVRLDEIPQFINVIKGDMSLVGPRPERQFYIDQIAEREPQYLQLTKVKPGITSWGQVKYGYAENIDQMLQRMKYDLLYLKNMSIALDLKIMLYTVVIVLKGTGK